MNKEDEKDMIEEEKDTIEKILEGIEMSFNKLLASRQKEDGELIIEKDGKIISIKARELKKTNVYSQMVNPEKLE
jgi:hypothetical protein